MRTLAWTQSAIQAVQRLNTDWARAISLRSGLASGEIDVLLIKRGNAAYDIWGRTLTIARRIAVDLPPGCVGVSESTYALLTDVEGFKPAPPIIAPVIGTLLSWTRPALFRAAVAAGAPAGDAPQTQAAE
jgi:class 3 adenylate cyclase